MFYDFEGIVNFRDLGGLCTSDGRRVKSNTLFRCGELVNASDTDLRRLSEELHIACVIDLRDEFETEERPDRSIRGADYLLLPALPTLKPEVIHGLDKERPAVPPSEMFPFVYRQLATSAESVNAYRAFFDCLLKNEGKPILWHCRQGKDRTGIAAILLLMVLGVSWKDCLQEYLLTNVFMQKRFDEKYAHLDDPAMLDFQRTVMFVRQDWLGEYLKLMDQNGGIEQYLNEKLKLTDAEILRLQDLYLEKKRAEE